MKTFWWLVEDTSSPPLLAAGQFVSVGTWKVRRSHWPSKSLRKRHFRIAERWFIKRKRIEINAPFSKHFQNTTNRVVTNLTLWCIKNHQSATLFPVQFQAAQLVLFLRYKMISNVIQWTEHQWLIFIVLKRNCLAHKHTCTHVYFYSRNVRVT